MENKKHLIALDLVGTLLTDSKEISARNKQMIFSAVEAGHIVVIATGRPHRATTNYQHERNIDAPIGKCTGALIHHAKDKKWGALHNPMPGRTALDVVETCHHLDVYNIMAELQENLHRVKCHE